MTQEDVRVVRGDPRVEYLQPRERRTEAQRTQDTILENATEHAETALEHLNKTLDWLVIVDQPKASKHRNLPVYAQQLLAELAELRRIRQ